MTGIRRHRVPVDLAERPGRDALVKVPLYFRGDVFDAVRRRAEREGQSFGEFVQEAVARRMGG